MVKVLQLTFGKEHHSLKPRVFDLRLIETILHFKNGTKMPVTATDFPAFVAVFVTERNKFFKG